jgi:hypothetical protein
MIPTIKQDFHLLTYDGEPEPPRYKCQLDVRDECAAYIDLNIAATPEFVSHVVIERRKDHWLLAITPPGDSDDAVALVRIMDEGQRVTIEGNFLGANVELIDAG